MHTSYLGLTAFRKGVELSVPEIPPINFLVAVLKKDRLSTIPTLRNVMRKAGNHRTR